MRWSGEQGFEDENGECALEEVAGALALSPHVPIIAIDARERESAKRALVRITEYALERLTGDVAVAR